jgi:hypothetical protein
MFDAAAKQEARALEVADRCFDTVATPGSGGISTEIAAAGVLAELRAARLQRLLESYEKRWCTCSTLGRDRCELHRDAQ